MYFTIEGCSPDQLDELRSVIFWAEDTDPADLDGITSPEEIPFNLLYSYFKGITFTADDFFCTAS